jgi:hypothetical protein
MKKLKKVAKLPLSIMKHIRRHPGTYIMTSIAVAVLILNARNLSGMNDFLIEKGINPDEFFLTPEDFEAFNS